MTQPALPPIHEETLSQLFREAFNADLAGLEDTQVIMELEDWDSLAHMKFITELEGRLGFELTGDEIADMQTVAQVKTVVAARAGAQS